MATKNISIKGELIKEKGGVAILDLEKYRTLKEKLKEYERKEKLLKNLEKFEILTKWGRTFARKKKITKKQVAEDD